MKTMIKKDNGEIDEDETTVHNIEEITETNKVLLNLWNIQPEGQKHDSFKKFSLTAPASWIG